MHLGSFRRPHEITWRPTFGLRALSLALDLEEKHCTTRLEEGRRILCPQRVSLGEQKLVVHCLG